MVNQKVYSTCSFLCKWLWTRIFLQYREVFMNAVPCFSHPLYRTAVKLWLATIFHNVLQAFFFLSLHGCKPLVMPPEDIHTFRMLVSSRDWWFSSSVAEYGEETSKFCVGWRKESYVTCKRQPLKISTSISQVYRFHDHRLIPKPNPISQYHTLLSWKMLNLDKCLHLKT